MSNYSILFPLFAQVALTAVVWVTMYVTRFREIARKKLPANAFVSRHETQQLLTESAPASDHLQNLFETPLLFFAGILTVFVTGLADHTFLVMGYVYVAARAIQALAAIVLRQVPLRFAFYVVSCLVLWIMWIRIAVLVLSSHSTSVA